ncbi:MAG: hypothetical protein M0Z41_01300 [Peptococcaceae bacterium]|nr:hypothetical protein [Peptococcaceae bacterium]
MAALVVKRKGVTHMGFIDPRYARMYERIKGDALQAGFAEEELVQPTLDKLSHQTRSFRIIRMVRLAYWLGWLRGIRYCDEMLNAKMEPVKISEARITRGTVISNDNNANIYHLILEDIKHKYYSVESVSKYDESELRDPYFRYQLVSVEESYDIAVEKVNQLNNK